jgi:hypothetical protein
MAVRDKSQGFAFVYTDLAKILAERDRGTREDAPVVPPPETQSVNFNKDVRRVPPPADAAATAAGNDARARATAIQEIKENLDRLQSLHHKLHAMLEELNKITEQEKKKR